jgi:hypothetical protein
MRQSAIHVESSLGIAVRKIDVTEQAVIIIVVVIGGTSSLFRIKVTGPHPLT